MSSHHLAIVIPQLEDQLLKKGEVVSWPVGWADWTYWARLIRARVRSILLKSQVSLSIKREEVCLAIEAPSLLIGEVVGATNVVRRLKEPYMMT